MGLDVAQVGRELPVALRLPALLGQLGQPGLLGGQQVEDPLQVGLGRLQPQLGLAPARLQAADAGGVLEQPAPVDGACESTMKPIWPWPMMAGLREPAPASANRSWTSRARTSRPLIR